MPAFIQNINPTELILIAIVAILIFGRKLPQVAGQVAGRVQQARRAFNDLKRETGIDEELRQAKRTFDQTVHDARFSAERDPSAPRIATPSSGSAVGRGSAVPDPSAPATKEPASGEPASGETASESPPVGGPHDGPHGGRPRGPLGAAHGDPLPTQTEAVDADDSNGPSGDGASGPSGRADGVPKDS